MIESEGVVGADNAPDAAGRHPDPDAGGRTGSAGTSPPSGELQPLAVSTARIVLWGQVGWVVALAVILAVPALHEGRRDWWPWVPVAGIVLGFIGYAYVRRGRGNAEGAE